MKLQKNIAQGFLFLLTTAIWAGPTAQPKFTSITTNGPAQTSNVTVVQTINAMTVAKIREEKERAEIAELRAKLPTGENRFKQGENNPYYRPSANRGNKGDAVHADPAFAR